MTTRAIIGQGWRHVRSGAFLPADRARAYATIFGAGCLLLGAAWLALYAATAMQDPSGHPVNNDFNAFWSAGRLALDGHGRLAYDLPALRLEEQIGAQPYAGQQMLPFLYPPVFLLFCLPFAALPFALAVPAFVLGGYGLYAASLRAMLPRHWPWLVPCWACSPSSPSSGCASPWPSRAPGAGRRSPPAPQVPAC